MDSNMDYETDHQQEIMDDMPGKRKKVDEYLTNNKIPETFATSNFGVASGNDEMKQNFNRFRVSEGLDYFTSNVTYIFFTKPQMNLLNATWIDDSFIRSMQISEKNYNRLIMQNLDGLSSSSGPFNFILSNAAESFDLKDNILKNTEVGENRLGFHIVVGDNASDSYNAGEFSVEYTEYSDMSITKMHKIWLDYIHLVKHNKAAPYMQKSSDGASLFTSTDISKFGDRYYSYSSGVTGLKDFVWSREIDYACSVYYFKLAEDGMTIKYWAKYTGVFPQNVPYSALSFSNGNNKLKEMTVNYVYSFKEDMSIEILEEFNKLCNDYGGWASLTTADNFDLKYNWAKGVCLSPNLDKLFFINK